MDKSNLYTYVLENLKIFKLKKKKDEEDLIGLNINISEEKIKQFISGKIYCDLSKDLNKVLLNTDHENFIKYLDFIKDLIEKSYIKKRNHEKIKNELYSKCNPLEFDDNAYKILLDWLIDNDIINNVINNANLTLIDESDIPQPTKKLKKFIPRINQKEAFDKLERNGLESGIHCQATGCGKTFIILRYIDYCIKKYGNNCKIILFTERVNILADLFDFKSKDKLTDKSKDTELNRENIEYWKEKGIADLSDINIINRVTIKKKNWIEILNTAVKPTLLVINRAFLTLRKKYQELESLSLILHDECHNTSSKMCHDFLLNQKYKNTPIVGFSATPLRTGKDDLTKLKEIYDQEEPLLTNYNMIYSISQELIIPPEFYWYQIDESKIDKMNKNIIDDMEIGTVLMLLSQIVKKMPNKKIIAWCGRIDFARAWKKAFTINYKKYQPLENFKFFLDTSKDTNAEYKVFKNIDSHAILFCANKHREGSDIRRLDSCIFLDRVKNRGSIPFIQSIGRVLRFDIENKKKRKGFIIEGIFKDDEYDKSFVDKIITYYLNLENILGELNEDNSESKTDKYIKIREMIKFNSKKDKITINFGSSKIIINLNQLGWDEVIKNFDGLLQKKINVSAEANFIYKGKILVEDFNFNAKTDFYTEYQNISKGIKLELALPDIEEDDYQDILKHKTWFEILDIKHNYYTDMKKAKESLKKKGIKLENAKKNWLDWAKEDNRLPHYPKYLWDYFNYSFFNEVQDNFLFL